MGNVSSASSPSPFAHSSHRSSLGRALPSVAVEVDDDPHATKISTTPRPLPQLPQQKQEDLDSTPAATTTFSSPLLRSVKALLAASPPIAQPDERRERNNANTDENEGGGYSKSRKAGKKGNAEPVPFRRDAKQHLAAVYALEQSSPFVGSPLSSSDYFPDAASTSRSRSSRARKDTSTRVTSASPPLDGKIHTPQSKPQKTSLLSSALAAAALVHQNSQGSKPPSASRKETGRPPTTTGLRRSASTSTVPDHILHLAAEQAVGMGSVVERDALSDRGLSFAIPEVIMDSPKKSYRNSAKIVHGFGASGGDVSPMRKLDFNPTAVVPTIITWSQGGGNVYVTGTFNGWKHKIRLSRRFGSVMFTSWERFIVIYIHWGLYYFPLKNFSTTDFTTVLDLPPGTHRFKFVVDGEWKCSEDLDVARDSEGNMVNTIKVAEQNVSGEDFENEFDNSGSDVQDDDGIRRKAESAIAESPSSPPTEYSFTLPKYLHHLDPTFNDNNLFANIRTKELEEDNKAASSLPSRNKSDVSEEFKLDDLPPTLPRHLEKVLLNTATPVPAKRGGKHLVPSPNLIQDSQQTHYFSKSHRHAAEDSSLTPPSVDVDVSALPVPNHVVINHLYACSIRDGVMAVASTVRYRRKYVTTILYKPVFS